MTKYDETLCWEPWLMSTDEKRVFCRRGSFVVGVLSAARKYMQVSSISGKSDTYFATTHQQKQWFNGIVSLRCAQKNEKYRKSVDFNYFSFPEYTQWSKNRIFVINSTNTVRFLGGIAESDNASHCDTCYHSVVCLSVCLHVVSHSCPCKSRWTEWDTVWQGQSCGSCPHGKARFGGPPVHSASHVPVWPRATWTTHQHNRKNKMYIYMKKTNNIQSQTCPRRHGSPITSYHCPLDLPHVVSSQRPGLNTGPRRLGDQFSQVNRDTAYHQIAWLVPC